MNQGGEVAEQVFKMSLDCIEVSARLTGAAAKQMAVLLYTILKQQSKTKGKMRLTNMLRSGKELRMFALPQQDLKRFCEEAKHYGIVYTVIRSPKATDGLVEIMVRAEDAGRLNTIFERFNLAKVDLAQISTELEKSIAAKQEDAPNVISEQTADTIVGDMLGQSPTQAAESLMQTAESPMQAAENPTQAHESPTVPTQKAAPARSRTQRPMNGTSQEIAQTQSEFPSAPSSSAANKNTAAFVEQTQKNARPSVRRELAAITEKQQAKRVALAPVKEATPLQAAPKIKTPKGR